MRGGSAPSPERRDLETGPWGEKARSKLAGSDGSVDSQGILEKRAAFLQKPFTSELLARKVRSVPDGAG
jgi:hypothetical protein